jgi:hypothetical protein
MEQYNANDRDGNQIYISPSGAVYRSYDDYALDNGMPTSTGQQDPGLTMNAQNLNGDGTPMYPNETQTQSSGGGGTATQPELVVYNGVTYDLNNPSDRQAFFELKSADIDKQLTEALKTGQLSYAAKLAETQDSLTEFMHSWESQGTELLSGYNQGQTARQQSYQGLGTRAYQSSMGTSGQYALNQLGEAQTERNYQKGIAEKQTKNATSSLEQAYNDWINSTGKTAQQNKDSLSTDVQAIGGFDTSKMSAPITSQSDLSPYTPFVNFTSLSNSPLVNNARTVSKTPTSQMTLSEWLQQNGSKGGNPLADYLAGKA